MKSAMLRFFVWLILGIYSCSGQAQKHDYYWVMGSWKLSSTVRGGGDLDFTRPESELVVEVIRDCEVDESVASVSDTEGNLLFWTNLCNVFDRYHEPVAGGERLLSGFSRDHFCGPSSGFLGYRGFQQSLILPDPSNEDLYYLFYTFIDTARYKTSHETNEFGRYVYYVPFDRRLNGGRGGLSCERQLLLDDTVTIGMMTAVKHGDGRSWWVLIPQGRSPGFFSFLLDERGVHGPFQQTIGTTIWEEQWKGQTTFSSDGTWYAQINFRDGLTLFRFDRCTGLLSDYLKLSFRAAKLGGYENVCFSPDGRYLYAGDYERIVQYDLYDDDINESVILIGEIEPNPEPFGVTGFGKMQAGPDGKIYISNWSNHYLHMIAAPNEKGVACRLEQHRLRLPTQLFASMPYMPNYRLGPVDCAGVCCDDGILESDVLDVRPNPSSGLFRVRSNRQDIQELSVYDLAGRHLETWTLVPCREVEVDLSSYPNGIYLLHVRTGDTRETVKVALMR